jgi:aquaporin Z
VLAEIVGTFFLTAVAAGIDVMVKVPDAHLGGAARALAPALTVAAIIFAIGDVSGAHINPAVTLAFVVRRAFPVRRVPAYLTAQIIGAIVAAAFVRGAIGDAQHGGSTIIQVTDGRGFAIEVFATFLLVTVILNVATKQRLVGPGAAVPVGATIAAMGLVAGSLTGPSMNPARSIGPAIVNAYGSKLWVAVVAPLTGAIAAAVFSFALHPRRTEDEEAAARGDDS